MEIFAAMAGDGYEQLAFCHDRATGLRAIVCIHDTTLGPALGGTRMLPYASEEEAVRDVLRLARAMTYKNAAAGLDHGGGKAVIIGDPKQDKSEALFRAYGRFVQGLGGRYVTTTDVGTTMTDMDLVLRETAFVTGYSQANGGSGDTSILTSVTVHLGMKAAAREAFGSDDLAGRHVAVQGAGKVGYHLMERLKADGCRITVTDVDPAAVERAVRDFGAEAVPPDRIFDVEADIFSPNALGAVLNDDTIPRLRCRVVCGGANNQLAEEHHAAILQDRGILYAPDFIVNCGGVINVADELRGYNRERAEHKAREVYETTLRVFAIAKRDGITTAAAADRLAEERIRRLAEVHRPYPGRA
ncbi:MAG TPA: amino acid dehydrogenase [Dehalococcoidia bacterium]